MPQDILTVLHDLVPLGAIGVIRHVAWIIKLILSAFWRDIRATGPLPYTKVAAAMTVKGEPPETFKLVLRALLREKIDQVCITFDKGETKLMELTDRFKRANQGAIDIRWIVTTEKGKRKGLKAAIEMVEGMDIIICMDSDTIFGKGVKEGIMHAFSKPGIGGVTVAQRAYKPSSLMHYLFDIRLKLRYVFEIPGQALTGHVSCLSGRCSAYLAEPLKKIVGNLTVEQWLGIKKVGGGEDKCLTTYLQDEGYKCAVVTKATVYTRPESSLKVYFNQSLRWARNSWFSDLRAIFTRRPWMVRDPVMLFYTLDRMMSTFTLIWAIWYLILLLLTNRWQAAGLLFAWWMISRAIKITPWILDTGKLWVVFPYAFVTFWLSFLKVHALVTLWETGWLTRGSGAGSRDYTKMIITNVYRFVTVSIIVSLGVDFAYRNNIWAADMPGIAEFGYFYRPGDDGLVVVHDVFPQGSRSTLLVVNDPLDLPSLEASIPTLIRLGDELKMQINTLQVVRASDLTEEQVTGSNVIFLDRPQETSDLTRDIAYAYDRPGLGERLLNVEPFAAESLNPMRVIRAPWNEKAWVVLADTAQQIHYRLRGQIVPPTDALVLVKNNLGDAFFAPAQVTAPDESRLLATLDAAPPDIKNTVQMQRVYRMIVTPDIDVATLVLNIEADALKTLQPGTGIELVMRTLGEGAAVSLLKITAEGDLTTAPIGERLQPILGTTLQTREVTITMNISRDAQLDPTQPDGNFWRQFEANASLTWKPAKNSLTPGLDSYPYPFVSMEENADVALIMPSDLTENDIHMLARLIVHLGANGVSEDAIHVMQPSTLNMEVLQNANIMMIGSTARQTYVQALDEQFRQTNELGMFDVLPDNSSGILLMKPSPWNPERSMILATGTTDVGETIASIQLLRSSPITETPASGAIVDAGSGIRPYEGFDEITLTTGSLTVSSAAVTLTPDQE